MRLKDYIAAREPFTKNGIAAEVRRLYSEQGNFPHDRLVCRSTQESNDNGTNGIRTHISGFSAGFYPFISSDDIEKMADVLTEESHIHGIQFNLDDELTREFGTNDKGYRFLCVYKMSLRRSPLL